MGKTTKLKITHPCFVKGEPKKVGDVVEVEQEDRNILVGMKRATENLDQEEEKKDKKEKK